MNSHENKSQLPLLVLSHITCKRDDRVILNDISLTVDKGDFVAITGPNGGGKTTTLRIILGLMHPQAGTVSFPQGKPSIGYLPQKNAIDSHFPITVREVVESGLMCLPHITSTERDARTLSTLEQIEMTDLAERPIGRLSGGQLQRTLLGRAIISNPGLLVLDEPLSYIDRHFEERLYPLIAEIAPHTTILLVSHQMSTISSMANRHIIIDRTLTECSAHHHYVPSECC